jgi:hypothetical protein
MKVQGLLMQLLLLKPSVLLKSVRVGLLSLCVSLCGLLSMSPLIQAAEPANTTAAQLEDLKKQVLSVNRDLFILEEDLLFPASTQVAVYVSLDMGKFFDLDNIKLKLDEQDVTHYLYTKDDIDALHRGAIQKLYLGNLATGKHQLVAVVIGKGPRGREYRRAVSFDFEKTTESKALEVQLRDDPSKQQIKLNVVEW